MAHGAGDVANLAERFGFSKDDAAKLGAAAVAGKDVTTAICTVADTHVLLG
jgi:hypothetical protein